MELIVSIYIGPLHQQPFVNPIILKLKSEYPTGQFWELDQNSDVVLLQAAQKLIQDSNPILVILDVQQAIGVEPISIARQILEFSMRYKNKIRVALLGSHTVLELMAKQFTTYDL